MTQSFPELTLGGVLVAPFVPYAGLALVLYVIVRPALGSTRLSGVFANPSLAGFCLYVIIVAILLVLF